MRKTCQCGEEMDLRLRTVIFSGKVEINNVPIFVCASCGYSEVFAPVKPDLVNLIQNLGSNPKKLEIKFQDEHELAHLMYLASAKERINQPIEGLVEERVNQLLDLLLLSRALPDESWSDDIHKRLSQITNLSTALSNY